MPQLIDLLATLDDLDPTGVIHATKPWSTTSAAAATADDVPVDGMAYLLEVDLALEVLQVWSAWRGGAHPSDLQKCAAIIHYAQHDSYEPLEPPADVEGAGPPGTGVPVPLLEGVGARHQYRLAIALPGVTFDASRS
jgi:hypothetical protein